MKPIIIVGTGLAGYSVARELRKLDPEIELVILTADDGRFYSKPMLSNAFTSGKTPETIANADAAKMAEQLKAEIRTFTSVTEIKPSDRTLWADDERLEYSQLVLAVGADPIQVPLAGNARDRILSVNDLSDYTRFRKAIEGARHLIVMGAGLIGCEFANDLYNAGISVEIVDPLPYPLNRFLPEPAGRALERALAALGVVWHLGQVITSVDTHNLGVWVTLASGERRAADAVLSAIGLRPRTRLAAGAGLSINRGIAVDRYLRTADPHIYALGDCAEVAGWVLPFVMPILHAARALARTLIGEPTEVIYPAMPVIVKTTLYPIVVSPARPGVEGQWTIEEREDGVEALYYANNSLEGFALTGSAVQEKNTLTKQLPPFLA